MNLTSRARVTVKIILAVLAMACAVPAFGQAPAQGIFGDWQEPGGSVLEVYKCGAEEVCMKIAVLHQDSAGELDQHNPNPALRQAPICGLRIGYAFKLADPDHAAEGKIYDPKSGKTYSATLAMEDAKLRLRGYLGLKVFGRTEVWPRAGSFERCTATTTGTSTRTHKK